jgi:hypothetical protein
MVGLLGLAVEWMVGSVVGSVGLAVGWMVGSMVGSFVLEPGDELVLESGSEIAHASLKPTYGIWPYSTVAVFYRPLSAMQ